MRLGVVLLVVALAGTVRAETVRGRPAATGALETTQARFSAAVALEARGQYREAAAALETLARERPQDPLAADALFEAAVIAEERLKAPARAQQLYQEVVSHYPSNRLARRARTRAEVLGRGLQSGIAPLRQYDEILARPRPDATAKMESLLSRHPDFALADRALFWLGQRYGAAGQLDQAQATYRRLEQRFPKSVWARRAQGARADLLLARGHPFAARALYRELASAPDPMIRAAGQEGLEASLRWLVRALLAALAAAYLLAYVARSLRGLRAAPAPLELLYYAPVALVFVLAAATEDRAIGWATAILAVGGAALCWLSAAATAVRLERGPLDLKERVARALALTLAILAMSYLAVLVTGLLDLVLETLRAGPDR